MFLVTLKNNVIISKRKHIEHLMFVGIDKLQYNIFIFRMFMHFILKVL